jgi:hypothetical protein
METMSRSIEEIIELYDAQFSRIKKPAYSEELKELSKLVIQIPGDFIDPDIIITMLDQCMKYRNKLLRKKISWSRTAMKLDRYSDSAYSIIRGMVSGTAQEKEGKATELCEAYKDQALDAQIAFNAIKEMLDNIDQAALQLSRMLKVLDQPFIGVRLHQEGEATQEEKLDTLRKWGEAHESSDDN